MIEMDQELKQKFEKEDFWDDTDFVDEYCPRCDCILRYDESDICCSCEELEKEKQND